MRLHSQFLLVLFYADIEHTQLHRT
jgi:hypothetical protein